MIFYAKTHKGKIRSENQDYIYVPKGKDGFFAIVADGMGGHNAGEVASKIAVETIVSAFSLLAPEEITKKEMKKAVALANRQVWAESVRDPEKSGMGSTITIAAFDNNHVIIGQVGDSRGYLFSEGKLQQITKDHSYVQALIDSNNISKKEALNHPQRNIITRAIGTQANVKADVYTLTIKENDCILLCSDGLNTSVLDERISQILGEGIETAAEKLVDEALDGGGTDNISVIIVHPGGERL